jgi:hypothetical protein
MEIKKEGHVKATKMIGTQELLIFNRYGRFSSLSSTSASGEINYLSPSGILYSYLMIDQNGIFSKNYTYSFSGGNGFTSF